MINRLGLISIVTLLLPVAVSAQFRTHYVQPHEVFSQLREVEANLPSLTRSFKEDEMIIRSIADPEAVLSSWTYFKHNISETCANQTLHLLNSFTDLGFNDSWGIQMLDSWGKPEAGITQLNIVWLGDYAECVAVDSGGDEYSRFTGQYCSIGAPPSNAIMAGIPSSINIGGCFPSGCSEKDIHEMLAALPGNTTAGLSVDCQVNDLPYSTGAIVTIVLYCIMGCICIAGTFYDFMFIITTVTPPEKPEENGREDEHMVNGVAQNDDTVVLVRSTEKTTERKHGPFGEFLMCFSLYTNGYKLLSTAQGAGALSSINGIRFISMTWVVLGHTIVFSASSISNILAVFGWFQDWPFMVILNATVSVDSFFVLSAVLTTYLFLKDLERKKPGTLKFLISVPVMYLHRYLRLTPAYGFMILLYTCLGLYMFNGPLKPPHTDATDKYCVTNWWGAIFYVNNVIESDKGCAAWGWYLSNDFQFFLVTPFIVYLMHLVPVAGFIVSIVLVIISAITATAVSAVHDFGMGVGGARDPNAGAATAQADYMRDYYFAPWVRYQSFGVGVVFGFLLWRFHGKIKIPIIVNLALWAASGCIMLLVLYANYPVVSNKRIATPAEAAIFNGWSRTAWSVALGYIILACCTGHGGWVNEFLSWPAFVPLGRMTYCAYLVHPVIMTVMSMASLSKVKWTQITLIYMFAGYLTLSYAVGFLFSLVFEAPFMLIDKKYLTGRLSKSIK